MTKTVRQVLQKPLWVLLSCLLLFDGAILLTLPSLHPDSGVPYFFAVAAQLAIIFVVTNKNERQHLFDEYQKPTAGVFFQWICFLGLTQLIFSYNSMLIEVFLNLFHLSAQAQEENATGAGETLSMFIYGSFVAPYGEEIIFRGFLLKNFKQYGTRFAIIFSAFLFGIYHGNIVQTPFAFILGILLGYIAVTYGLKHAIYVHIFNNLILADFLERFLGLFSNGIAWFINGAIIGSLSLLGIYYLIRLLKNSKYKLFVPLNTELLLASVLNIPAIILGAICLYEMYTSLIPLK